MERRARGTPKIKCIDCEEVDLRTLEVRDWEFRVENRQHRGTVLRLAQPAFVAKPDKL